MTDSSSKYLSLATSLLNDRTGKRLEWKNVVRMVMPWILQAADLHENDKARDRRICSQAAEAATKLTSAHMSYITPMGEKWFRFSAWDPNADDDSEDWFAAASDVAQESLERSNFYSQLLSVYCDRVATGTGLLFCSGDPNSHELIFSHIPAGTYALAEDANHEICTVVREFLMTAAQLYQYFPSAQFSKEVQAAYEDLTRRFSEQFVILHLVTPRDHASDAWDATDPTQFKYASIYIEKESRVILEESGYPEFPYMATRFAKYGNQVYGTSPLLTVENVIKDLMVLDQVTITAAQRKAIPSLLIPPEMLGQVDVSAGGLTILPVQYINASVPREWAAPSDDNSLLEHKAALEKQLKDALYVTFLEVISSVDREMTAKEVNARESEKVMAYAQTFTQFVCDFKPMLVRIFSLLLRFGMFPTEDMPENVFESNGKERFLKTPRINYIGRMSQAFERAQLYGTMSSVSGLLEIAQVSQNPQLLMFIDWKKLARGVAIANGMPAKYMLPSAEVERMERELQTQADQERDAAAAVQYAEAQERSANAAATMNELSL